jgi:hypothetical protein
MRKNLFFSFLSTKDFGHGFTGSAKMNMNHGMRFNIIFYIMPVSVFFRKSQQHHPKKMKFSLF